MDDDSSSEFPPWSNLVSFSSSAMEISATSKDVSDAWCCACSFLGDDVPFFLRFSSWAISSRFSRCLPILPAFLPKCLIGGF